MKKIKTLAFIGIISIAYFVGMIMGFGLCATTQSINATPSTANVQNMNMSSGVNTQSVYIEGQQYIVFTSGRPSMAVVKK